MLIRNEDIAGVTAEVPAGHRHLRISVRLMDGTELVFQEATMANIVRAYVTIKTHPTVTRLHLGGRPVADRKAGYAEWQLLEMQGEFDQ